MIQIAGIQINGAPNVSFLLVARVVADRFDRRHIMMLTQAVVGGIIVALAFLTIAGLVSTWHIYVAAVFMGIFQSLSMPARMTIIDSAPAPSRGNPLRSRAWRGSSSTRS